MKTLKRNKQKMLFANLVESQPIFERDSVTGEIIYDFYTDSDGESYYYPREVGQTVAGYSVPQEMQANIAMSGGEAEAREFGVDISQYSAVLICDKGAYDINETSLIWFKNEVGYKDTNTLEIEPNSADYRVVKVSESINYTRYLLQKVVNNEA